MRTATASASLCDQTLDMLKTRPVSLTYAAIAEQAKLTVPWIEAFRAGNMREPSVHKVQRLHDCLFAHVSRA